MEAVRPLSHDYLKYSCIFPPCQPSFLTFFLERKKAKNFYVAGATSRWDVVQRPTEAAAETGAERALARIYAMDLRPRFLAVSEWFPSDSPPAGLLLDKKGHRTFMSRALRPGGTLSSARPRRQPRPALGAPWHGSMRQICVRGVWQCWKGFPFFLGRKKAKNFYAAGRRLTRLGTDQCDRFASASLTQTPFAVAFVSAEERFSLSFPPGRTAPARR